MKTLIATPSKAYQNDRGLTLVQKDIVFMGGTCTVETYPIEQAGKEPIEGRRLRIKASVAQRMKKGKGGEEPLPTIAEEIRTKLEQHYLWTVDEVGT